MASIVKTIYIFFNCVKTAKIVCLTSEFGLLARDAVTKLASFLVSKLSSWLKVCQLAGPGKSELVSLSGLHLHT